MKITEAKHNIFLWTAMQGGGNKKQFIHNVNCKNPKMTLPISKSPEYKCDAEYYHLYEFCGF